LLIRKKEIIPLHKGRRKERRVIGQEKDDDHFLEKLFLHEFKLVFVPESILVSTNK